MFTRSKYPSFKNNTLKTYSLEDCLKVLLNAIYSNSIGICLKEKEIAEIFDKNSEKYLNLLLIYGDDIEENKSDNERCASLIDNIESNITLLLKAKKKVSTSSLSKLFGLLFGCNSFLDIVGVAAQNPTETITICELFLEHRNEYMWENKDELAKYTFKARSLKSFSKNIKYRGYPKRDIPSSDAPKLVFQ